MRVSKRRRVRAGSVTAQLCSQRAHSRRRAWALRQLNGAYTVVSPRLFILAQALQKLTRFSAMAGRIFFFSRGCGMRGRAVRARLRGCAGATLLSLRPPRPPLARSSLPPRRISLTSAARCEASTRVR